MIGFIGTSVTSSLNHTYYSAIADLHTFQFTVAHALGFSVFTSHLLATDLNTETSTSNHYEVFLSFLVQSPWNLGTQLKTPSATHSSSLLLACLLLPLTTTHCLGILLTYIDAARTRITENTRHVIATQPVHWCAGWTYRKHMSRRYPASPLTCWLDLQKTHHVTATHCCVTAPVVLAVCALRALPSNGFACHDIW
jgi:hypothetical protein